MSVLAPITPSAPPPPDRHRRRRRAAQAAALIAVAAGVVVAAVAWVLADRRYDDNVAAFARAPAGCDTTLQFDDGGEFVLYIETTGAIGDLAGDCDRPASYDRSPDGLPQPELTLRDPDGAPVVLRPTAGVDYDTGTYVGTAYRLADLEATGAYVLTVDTEDTEDTGDAEPYAVAVGRSPSDGVSALRWAAVAALAVGLAAGVALLVAAGRRTGPGGEPAADEPWRPTAPAGPQYQGWPQGPPGRPVAPPTTGAVAPVPGEPLLTPPGMRPTDRAGEGVEERGPSGGWGPPPTWPGATDDGGRRAQ